MTYHREPIHYHDSFVFETKNLIANSKQTHLITTYDDEWRKMREFLRSMHRLYMFVFVLWMRTRVWFSCYWRKKFFVRFKIDWTRKRWNVKKGDKRHFLIRLALVCLHDSMMSLWVVWFLDEIIWNKYIENWRQYKKWGEFLKS